MIVCRTWIKDRREEITGVMGTKRIRTYWRGYFLFGIIPLYIENYKTTYS